MYASYLLQHHIVTCEGVLYRDYHVGTNSGVLVESGRALAEARRQRWIQKIASCPLLIAVETSTRAIRLEDSKLQD